MHHLDLFSLVTGEIMELGNDRQLATAHHRGAFCSFSSFFSWVPPSAFTLKDVFFFPLSLFFFFVSSCFPVCICVWGRNLKCTLEASLQLYSLHSNVVLYAAVGQVENSQHPCCAGSLLGRTCTF